MRNMIRFFFAFTVIASLISCGSEKTLEKAVAVSAYQVKSESIIYYDSYPGTVSSLNQVEIRGQVTGYVTGIFFNDAQHVVKGQKLYEIDRSKYAASYEQTKANVDIAQANLEKAQKDADRYTQLNEEEAIAKQRLEYALTDLQSAKLRLVAARADLTKAQTDLNYSIITAPFDGTIGMSLVKLGTSINQGQTLLNTISSDDPMAVDFVINEKAMIRFQKIMNQNLPANDSTFKMVLPDDSMYPSYGKLSFIDRAVDPQTGSIKVRLIFENKQHLLKPGMSCNVQVLNDNSGSQVAIPYKSVFEQMGEYFIFKIKGDTAKQVKVDLGLKFQDKVAIREGLKNDDSIVLEGVQKLHDGSLIKIESSGKEAKKTSK